MKWNKLSMADRAKYIQLGVQNGITSLSIIRDTYNKYAEGGDTQGEFIKISEVPTYGWDSNTMIKDPSGSIRKFSDVLRQTPDYKILVDSETYKPIFEESIIANNTSSQDIIEKQISNITRNNKGIDIYQGQQPAREKFREALNEAGIFSDLRAKNYSEAMKRNPNFSTQWNMASNIAEFMNIGTAGMLNRLDPTQNIRLIYDAITGENIGNSLLGNNGIVSDKFAKEHPYWSMLINGAAGAGITGGGMATISQIKNPQSYYNMRRGLTFAPESQQRKVFSDMLNKDIKRQMEGIDIGDWYKELGADYADELQKQGLLPYPKPLISGNNYYHRTTAPWNSSKYGVKRGKDLTNISNQAKTFMSYGEPWMEFRSAPTLHEFPFETFGERASADWNGIPTGIPVTEVYNGHIGPNLNFIEGASHPKAQWVSPRDPYTGFQNVVPTKEYLDKFMTMPHTTYERRVVDDMPYLQKIRHKGENYSNGEKHYLKINKPFSEDELNSLDWSDWSKGGEISKEHLQEYASIEKESKLNGTWLRMPNGSIWNGDPRSWVQMQSKDFKKFMSNNNTSTPVFPNTVFVTRSPNKFDSFESKYIGTNFDKHHYSGDYGSGFYFHPQSSVKNGIFDHGVGAYGENIYNVITNISTPYTPSSMADGQFSSFSELFNTPSQPEWMKKFDSLYSVPVDITTDIGSYKPELVIKNPRNIKSIIGNNGDFNINSSNIYKSLIPLVLSSSLMSSNN